MESKSCTAEPHSQSPHLPTFSLGNVSVQSLLQDQQRALHRHMNTGEELDERCIRRGSTGLPLPQKPCGFRMPCFRDRKNLPFQLNPSLPHLPLRPSPPHLQRRRLKYQFLFSTLENIKTPDSASVHKESIWKQKVEQDFPCP